MRLFYMERRGRLAPRYGARNPPMTIYLINNYILLVLSIVTNILVSPTITTKRPYDDIYIPQNNKFMNNYSHFPLRGLLVPTTSYAMLTTT